MLGQRTFALQDFIQDLTQQEIDLDFGS